jgi:hypothetical protein
MNLQFATSHFTSEVIQDLVDGFVAVRLLQRRGETVSEAARITLWDADGTYYLETFNTDVPLVVIKQLIQEAEGTIDRLASQ